MSKRWGLVYGCVVLAGCGGGGGGTDAGCPDGSGRICIIDNDAQSGTDAGADGGMPAMAGTIGGRCRMGTTCATGSTCADPIINNPMTGTPLTFENTFIIPIPTAEREDPDHPGEYLVNPDPTMRTQVPLG